MFDIVNIHPLREGRKRKAMSTDKALEPHPFSQMFPPISKEDFDKLIDDIKANGLHNRIVRYQGKILDGNNRYRACDLTGIEPAFADFTGIDADAKTFVISMNINRRHLDPETRKRIATELMKLDPTKSDRQLGEQSKLDHKTVGKLRAVLEAGGEIPTKKLAWALMVWRKRQRRKDGKQSAKLKSVRHPFSNTMCFKINLSRS